MHYKSEQSSTGSLFITMTVDNRLHESKVKLEKIFLCF